MFEKNPYLVQLYLFLCSAFVTFVSTFLPWVCYETSGERACADGYSRELFAAGGLNLLDNGGVILLLMLIFALFAALNRRGLDTRGAPTALGALIILFLATLFFINAAWQGNYQPPQEGAVPTLQIGLVLALLGEVAMVTTVATTWLAVRPTRPTLAMEIMESGNDQGR